MSVWTDAEKDEVEDGKTSRVFLSELVNKRFLVRVCELFEIVQESDIQVVNVFGWYGYFAE